ncbi:MAG TPA: hypothetical protein VFV93_13980 [Thermomicrobiales bacterium]|nr:hypothetical protein [Thermomicrobiales bacterium]
MLRRLLVGLIACAGIAAGGWALLQRANRSPAGEPDAVQWPFDTEELRSLMGGVVAEQRDRINAIEDEAGRDRARSFLAYYERRRQAVAS